MIGLITTGGAGVLTGAVVFLLTGYGVRDWQWWALMVPASWGWTAMYHVIDRNRRG